MKPFIALLQFLRLCLMAIGILCVLISCLTRLILHVYPNVDPRAMLYVQQMLMRVVMLLLALTYLHVYKKKRIKSLFKPISCGHMAATIGLQVLMFFLLLLWNRLNHVRLSHPVQAIPLDSMWYFGIWGMVLTLLVGALGEEFIFRAIFQRIFQALIGKTWIAILLSNLLFAGYHMQSQCMDHYLIMGCFLGLLYHSTDNLVYPIVVHVLYNLGVALIEYRCRDWVVHVNSYGTGICIGLLILVSALISLLFMRLERGSCSSGNK